MNYTSPIIVQSESELSRGKVYEDIHNNVDDL